MPLLGSVSTPLQYRMFSSMDCIREGRLLLQPWSSLSGNQIGGWMSQLTGTVFLLNTHHRSGVLPRFHSDIFTNAPTCMVYHQPVRFKKGHISCPSFLPTTPCMNGHTTTFYSPIDTLHMYVSSTVSVSSRDTVIFQLSCQWQFKLKDTCSVLTHPLLAS